MPPYILRYEHFSGRVVYRKTRTLADALKDGKQYVGDLEDAYRYDSLAEAEKELAEDTGSQQWNSLIVDLRPVLARLGDAVDYKNPYESYFRGPAKVICRRESDRLTIRLDLPEGYWLPRHAGNWDYYDPEEPLKVVSRGVMHPGVSWVVLQLPGRQVARYGDEATEAELDVTDAWHEGRIETETLAEALGMTEDEYTAYVEGR